MKSALGTQKWLTLTEHNSTLSCVEKLRNNGYRIMASDLNPDAKSIHSIDWNSG
jgi:tRNA (guanosine-2'-O-)-methyltransferase